MSKIYADVTDWKKAEALYSPEILLGKTRAGADVPEVVFRLFQSHSRTHPSNRIKTPVVCFEATIETLVPRMHKAYKHHLSSLISLITDHE